MSRGAKIGVWVLVGAGLVAVFGVTGAKRMKKEEVKSIQSVQQTEGIPVDVVKAQVVPLEDWRKFVGVGEGYEQVNLVAPFRTRVSKVHVALGQEIGPGRVLISLDPYDPAWAGMNLKTAEAGYQTARQDSIRVEELFKTGAVSQQDLDHIRAATHAARAQYITSRRAVELDTPIAGVVTALNVKAGDYAASEQTLATVASYRRIRVQLELSESDRALVAVGARVRCAVGDRGSSGQFLTGEVVRAALSADPTTRLFAVEILVDNPDRRLMPGTLVAPEILVGRSADKPVIPADAIVKTNGERYVYVVDEAGGTPTARQRPVVEGMANGSMAAMAGGVSEGDLVVVWGQNNLEDGAKVKIHSNLTARTYGAGQ
ncbi:MAG: efflux RND transporter periplasmic adaptor subunit [bacterium]